MKENNSEQAESSKSKVLTKAMYFERVVGNILKENYDIIKEPLHSNSKLYDFRTRNGVNFEVKYTSQSDMLSFSKYLRNLVVHNSISELDETIFVANVIKSESSLPNTIASLDGKIFYILTIENLLYLCGDDEKLRQELVNCLHISTENIVPQPLDNNIQKLLLDCKKKVPNKANHKKEKPLKELLHEIQTGQKHAGEYEKFCEKLVSTIFQDSIENLTEQKVNNQGLYRFDLIGSLKEDPKSFWKFIYDKYNSCFILFECKNYDGQITQNEIYSTERYLYNNALRNVAIIFTRKGVDKHGDLAAQGILKEHGKLILIFNDEDIIRLIDAYNDKKADETKPSPSDIVFARAKEFLLNLDK